MDNTLLIIIGALVVLGIFWFMRNRGPEPPGTYDEEDVRSRGSIGGEDKQVYDEEGVRSRGSIGEQEDEAYDDPEHRSGGSFGGD